MIKNGSFSGTRTDPKIMKTIMLRIQTGAGSCKRTKAQSKLIISDRGTSSTKTQVHTHMNADVKYDGRHRAVSLARSGEESNSRFLPVKVTTATVRVSTSLWTTRTARKSCQFSLHASDQTDRGMQRRRHHSCATKAAPWKNSQTATSSWSPLVSTHSAATKE